MSGNRLPASWPVGCTRAALDCRFRPRGRRIRETSSVYLGVAAAARPVPSAGSDRALARVRTAALIFGLFCIPGLISSSQVYAIYQQEKHETLSFWQALAWQMPPWWLWAAFTPLVVWLAGRF